MGSEIVVNFAICETARQCAKIFSDLFPSALSSPVSTENDILEDQLARFKIWAGNLGVFAGGRSSADYRLRDDQDIKDVIVRLLQRLSDNLKLALPRDASGQDISERDEKNDEEEYSSDSSLGLSDDDGLQDDEDEASTQAELPQEEHIKIIDDTISQLYKITSIIKKPEVNNEDQRINRWLTKEGHNLEHQLQELESYISWSLERNFPPLQESPLLKDRLVQSVLCRRRRLLYRENHRIKLEKGTDDSFPQRVPELAFRPQQNLEPKPDGNLNEFIPPQQTLPVKAVTFVDTEASVVNRKGFSAYAKSAVLSTISPSVKDGFEHLDVPPPPELSKGATEAICPYCSLPLGRDIIGRNKHSQWIHHVLQDIRPFICLFTNCDSPLRQYMTKDDWISHMASQHNRIWACRVKGHEEYLFQNPTDLRAHLQEEHPNILDDNEISFIIEKSAKSGPDTFAALAVENMSPNAKVLSACPFCNEPETQLEAFSDGVVTTFPKESYKKIRDHISGHLESISLESLPPRDDVEASLSGHRESDASASFLGLEADTRLQASRPSSNRSFEVAIICTLPLESEYVLTLFDTHWDNYSMLNKATGDQNAYYLGAVGPHNVVLVRLTGMENSNELTSSLATFPCIKLALLVGICGVAPSTSDDEIILGDVIFGDNVVQYDFGRSSIDSIFHKVTTSGSSKGPNIEVSHLLDTMKELQAREVLNHKMAANLEILRDDATLAVKYPGTEHDNLFKPVTMTEKTCSGSPCECKSVPRRRLQMDEDPEPHFHFGTFASGNSVIKSGTVRDSIGASGGVIAFDMESASIPDALPFLVIRGACDYADSHKNKIFQRYAAATAAAFSNAILSLWTPSSQSATHDITYHIPFPSSFNCSMASFPADMESAHLDATIEATRKTFMATPQSDPDWKVYSAYLLAALRLRSVRTGSLTDLNEAIDLAGQVTRALENNHQDLVIAKGNLSTLFKERFAMTSNMADLDEAINLVREAITIFPEGDQERAIWLNNLAVFLKDKFESTGNIRDLDSAIEVGCQAEAAGPDHPDRAGVLENLSSCLLARFSMTNSITDLNKCISIGERAAEDTPETHIYRAGLLTNLAGRLWDRYGVGHDENDLRLAYQYDCEALSLPTAPTSETLLAASHLFASPWARVTPNDAVEYADKALQLLPQLTPNFLQHEDKEHLLLKAAWLASNVVAISLLAMDERADEASVDETLAKAVTWLEMGRGVLASGIRDMRTDMSALTQQHPNLAADFNDSKLVLGAPVPSILSPEEDSQRKALFEHEKRRKAQEKLSSTIAEIRKQPGFERFLTFPSQAEILNAAAYGPIIIVNISLHRSDLLIISRTGIRLVKLSDNVYKETSSFSEKVSSQPSTLFHWMWDSIVGPALDHLGFYNTLPFAQQRHVWWIPTGPLVGFPLHAAGYHLEKKGRTALDRVVSSYATSVRSIIKARQTSPSKTAVPSLVLVAMDHTPGLGSGSYLKYAKSEIEAAQAFGCSINIQSTFPLKQKEPVLSALNKCEIFHFAGHGYAHATQPLLSHLLLEDWQENPLTVENLLDTNLNGSMPFLAYLSACGTGQILNEKFMDGSIHLSSACQLSGFRHVIGTLWSVEDELCVTMAKRVYETLAARGLEDAAVGYGLHLASRQFRDEWVQGLLPTLSTDKKRYVVKRNEPEWGNMSWVPYVHYGV